ncbi:hypothetical protein M0G43_14520 [Subsaxibacter sp. CAU 1640]|uniref:hypothetical protein n=1 Tax=Subsaxibacter sp. CAU 1640 TaxID=2933271 RepID=UPI002005AC70|nr:hypothetical protein [Subsaxibacter sp. CAU 1640]MCK7591800.1 hypothetical protein [Subsaxibacter sp. CAU 1640]
MKSSLIACCVIFLLISCKDDKQEGAYPVTNHSETDSTSLEGTWELIGFYNYIDNKVADSFKTRDGYRQVKMYTPTKVMWSKHVPTDSTEWFGYGSYKVEDGHLTEVLDYGSEMMSKIIQERKEFIYELHLKENRFSQIEIDEDGNRIYSENYQRIE